MFWSLYKYLHPHHGALCIMVRPSKSGKPISGMFSFNYCGDGSFWATKNGIRIKCLDIDKWCPVDDVIENVQDRLLDEFEDEVEHSRYDY